MSKPSPHFAFDRDLVTSLIALLVVLLFSAFASAQDMGMESGETAASAIESAGDRAAGVDADVPSERPNRARFRDRFMRRGGDADQARNPRGMAGEPRGDRRLDGDRPGRGGPPDDAAARGRNRDGQGRDMQGDQERGPRPERGDREGRRLRALMRGIDLTEAQQEQVRQVMREASQPMQQYMADNADALRDARSEMMEAREAQDREAMRSARDKLRAILDAGPRPDRDVMHQQVRDVLTPEQQAVFDENVADFRERMEAFRQRREQMQDGEGRGRNPQASDGPPGEPRQRGQGRRQGPPQDRSDRPDRGDEPARDQLDL